MGEQELTECRHATDSDAEPFLLQKIITHAGKSLNVHHHHHHHHTRLLPKFFIKTRHKFILHIFTCILIFASLATNISYLVFKIKLYYKDLHKALAAPWLLIILGCECLYVMGSMIAAVDYLVPPTPAKPPSSINNMNGYDEYDAKSDLAASKRYPLVHVMIPCCKEPTDVPQESVLAALALNYPKDRFKVFVLDDGGDDDLKAFCDTMRVESGSDQLVYLRREKVIIPQSII